MAELSQGETEAFASERAEAALSLSALSATPCQSH